MMNTYPVCLLLLCLCAAISCKSLSYFESPNNLRNIPGTVYLQNGRTVEGKLTVQTENLFGSPVRLFAEGDEKPMQFDLDDVRAYQAQGAYYEVKQIREALSLGRRRVFMKRLTPAKSRMHLYEYHKKETVNKTSARHTTELYVQLPGEEGHDVYAASGATFVPAFDEKMGRLLGDCPQLAKKIASREQGYFYHQVNLLKDQKTAVLLRIINEYNRCAE